jgi:hypothetical protein
MYLFQCVWLRYSTILSMILYFSVSCTISAVSFDELFPVSWYEKVLNSTTSAWGMISKHDPLSLLTTKDLTVLIGQCAFAAFCVDSMQNDQCVSSEDKEYLKSLLYRIKNRLATHAIENQKKDYIHCLEQIIIAMDRNLHSPCNI